MPLSVALNDEHPGDAHSSRQFWIVRAFLLLPLRVLSCLHYTPLQPKNLGPRHRSCFDEMKMARESERRDSTQINISILNEVDR